MLFLRVFAFAVTASATALVEQRELQEVHYDSDGGCQYHEYEVHADEFILSFSLLMTNIEGWQSIRCDTTSRDYGEVQILTFNGQPYFALAGNYPSEHWFDHKFAPNVQYDVSIEYIKAAKTVSLTVDGTLVDTKEFWNTRCACITPGYVGCYMDQHGKLTGELNGTISNLDIAARGVHSMRSRPEDRLPATQESETAADQSASSGSSDVCRFHDYEVHANEITLSFHMLMTDKEGWQTIRNDNGWDYGDVHTMLFDGQLYFAIAGNYPTEHWFSYRFEADVQYHVILDYSKDLQSVTLTVDGEPVETKEYWGTRCVCITPGHIGCWKHHGSLKDHFKGTIHDLEVSARGVHDMRNRPADRRPAVGDQRMGMSDDAAHGTVSFIIAIVVISCLAAACAAVAVRLKKKNGQLLAANEALAEEEVVGRPLEGYQGQAEAGKAVLAKTEGGKTDEKPYVVGGPVANTDGDADRVSATVVRVLSSKSTSPNNDVTSEGGRLAQAGAQKVTVATHLTVIARDVPPLDAE